MKSSEIFDFTRLRESIHYPIIDWADLKNGSEHVDRIGCWSVWMAAKGDDDGSPRGSTQHGALGLGTLGGIK